MSHLSLLVPAYYISAGIMLYSAGHALVLRYVGGLKPLYLLFALMCLAAGAFQLTLVAFYEAQTLAAAMAALHAQVAAGCVFLVAFFPFVALYTNQAKFGAWLALIALILAAHLALDLQLSYGLHYASLAPTQPLELPWGEQVGHFRGIGDLLHLVLSFQLVTLIFAWAALRCIVQYRAGERRAALLLGACLLAMVVCASVNAMDDLGLVQTLNLVGFAFLGFIVLMSVSLGRDLRERTVRLEAAATELRTEMRRRTQTEATLRQSEEKLRGLFEQTSLGIARTDMQGRYMEFNQAFAEICGYTAEELAQLDYWTLTPEKYQADEQRQLESLRRTGRYGPYEKEYLRKDGSRIPIRLNGFLVTEPNGQQYIWSIIEDIKEASRAKAALSQESRKNLALLRSASDGVHILDRDGLLLEASDSFCDMLGYRRDEIIGCNVATWDAQLNPAALLSKLDGQRSRMGRTQFETRHRRKDGSLIDVEVSGVALEIDGKLLIFNSSRDITERKRAEHSLRESEERLRAVIEQSPISIGLSRRGITVDVNAVYLQTFGFDSVEEVRGHSLLEQIAPQCRADIEDRVRRRALGENVESSYETVGLRKDGAQFPAFVSAKELQFPDGPLTIAFLVDVTRQKASEEEIRRLAFYDHLTHLANRQLLNDRVRRTLASSQRRNRHAALLLIDLDHFKTINDTLGHDSGDKLLREVSQRITRIVRDGDTVARLGGDEFVVLLEDLSERQAEAVAQAKSGAEKILASVGAVYDIDGKEIHCTCSIGVTLFRDPHMTPEDLIKQADIAMYEAKYEGRNALRFFDPQMQELINSRAALERDLHKALEASQFALHYQIQVDGSYLPIGAEALIRWTHPERGSVPPGQFIALAEETGLIVPIGQWVLQEACAQLANWRQNPLMRELVLAINVSSKQLRRPDFVEMVRLAVQQHGVNPGQLKLELTESMLVNDIEEIIATMSTLRSAGVRFSLDDFGTGYSSLQYLKRLPLDQLKIDQSFVRDIAVDANDYAIVRTVVAMANSLNVDVIAEGVETEEQRNMLRECGCLHFQGYLFGRPVPARQLECLVEANLVGLRADDLKNLRQEPARPPESAQDPEHDPKPTEQRPH